MIKWGRGNTIIEILVATTLISLAILASLSLSSQNQKQTDYSEALNTATFYNSQAIDWLRNMRTQLGWATFVDKITQDQVSGVTIYCLNNLPATTSEFISLEAAPSCASSYLDNTYQREATLTVSGTDSVSVTIKTWWQDRQHYSTTESQLTKW